MKSAFFRSLSVKLTLAFIGVGIITILSVALIVGQQTQRDFNRFIRDRIEVGLAEDLVAYYAANGTWSDVDRTMRQPGDEGPPGNGLAAEPPTNGGAQEMPTDSSLRPDENAASTQGVQIVAGLDGPAQGFSPIASIRVPFTIIGTNGKVIYSATMMPGEEASAAQMERGTPLLLNGEILS